MSFSSNTLRSAGILGIGSYVPETVLTNDDLAKIVDTDDEWIRTRTGIRERRVAAPGETINDLAHRAAAAALADAGIDATELDLIIVCTVSAQTLFPVTACVIQDRLGAAKCAAFDLNIGCSGFIYGLATAAQFVRTGMYRRVLVVGSETLSRITNWRDRATCVLFGDGAGAAVIGPVEEGGGFLAFDLGTDGSGGEQLAVVPGGWGHPLSTGSEDELYRSIQMDGKKVFIFAVQILEESTRRTVDRAGLSVDDIDLLVPHQANTRIIDAAAKRLQMDESRVFSNVERYGNTSAASIPIALVEARSEGRLKDGDTVALVGFGAGLSWASCILRWGKSCRLKAK
jgi:3-oxoacyl-[acyl-carrier-protein] synthase-3